MRFNLHERPKGQPGCKALILFLSLGMPGVFEAQAQLCMVNRSQSAYRIVVSSSAIPSERYAAEELQAYLGKVSGAKLPIVLDNEPGVTRERG